ncbi:MAG: hypothetical protein WC073_15470 [Sterolibacterium sp.]
MKQKWLELAARFDALARRERGMVAAAILFGGGMLGYSSMVEPQLIRQNTQAKRITQATTDLSTIESQLVAIQAKLKDPDASNRATLLQERQELAVLNAKLRSIETSMVPPDKMQTFLESLLSKNRNLELLALRTLTPTSLIERHEEKKADGKTDAVPAPGAGAAPNIYKHGVEIRIAGSYNDLLMYLAEIERMPQRIIWNRVKLSAEQYPRNELTLTVYTLSLDKQWLVV